MNRLQLKTTSFYLLLLWFFMISWLIPETRAYINQTNDDSDENALVGVKRKGVIHNIAEDRRVERITGGVYEPEGLDIYLKRHLDEIHMKLASMQSDMISLKADMAKVIKMMEPSKSLETANKQKNKGLMRG